MHLLSFLLADKEYAVDIDSVNEVRRIKAITPIPQATDFIEGVVSLRGAVVPIINLKKKLGFSDDKHASFNRVLIAKIKDHTIGITVDEVIGVASLDQSEITNPDEILKDAKYLTGVGRLGKRLILIIDIAKLLSTEEVAGIGAMHKRVEVRKRG